jgi:hypothetical protein
MKKTYLLIAVSIALVQGCYTAPPYQSSSRVSVGVGYPGVNIGINYSSYPDLIPVPGHPVYYAPGVNSNYFFYDGLYWVFQGDNWYASSWYNGPWDRVGYYDVPVYVLRVPVRYYRQPPPFFRDWRADAPPRWGDHWGRDWEQRRSGWDRWDRASAPPPAPLPIYQRNYSGDRYPHAVEQQQTIRSDNYRYQPRDPFAQQSFRTRVQQDAPRPQDQQRQQQDLQRQQDQQRQQQDLQRRQDQQRQQQDLQRQQDQQRQQQDLQRQQDQQRRQQDQPRQQDQQRRQQDQPRQQDQQRQTQDQPRQRSQPETNGKDYRASPQDRVKKDKDAQQADEWKKKKEEERDRSR